MPEERRDHVIRARLPWRTDDLTECGRALDDVATHITREQLLWRIKQDGQQRTAFTICITCWQTSNSHSRATWETQPSEMLARESRRGRSGIVYYEYQRDGRPPTGPHVDRLSAELHAMAALIEAHREEFDQRVTSASEAALFAERRRLAQQKRGEKRGS